MNALQVLYSGWESVLTELQFEYEFMSTVASIEEYAHYSAPREAVVGMTYDEAKYFYTTMINSTRLHAYLEIFAWYEKFLFDDLKKRVDSCSSPFCTQIIQLEMKKRTVYNILEAWKKFTPLIGHKDLYIILEDTRAWRNYVAHGQRFSRPKKSIPLLEDVFTAINLLSEYQQKV